MITTAEFITGPADLYWKLFGDAAAEPADPSITPASGWNHAGALDGPTNITIAQSFETVTCQQIVDALFSLPSDRSFGVEVGLMQPTLEHVKLVTNGGTITSEATVEKFEPETDLVGTEPVYIAVLVRGMGSDTGKMRDIIARRVLVVDDVEFAYAKATAQVLRTTWRGHYVSPSIPPFTMNDLKEAA
jgi:hypothetical protein